MLISADEAQLTIVIVPQSLEGQGGQTPAQSASAYLRLAGTPSELNAEFGALVSQYSDQRESLAEQLAATAAVLDAAKKASSQQAAKAVVKTNGAKTAEKKVDSPAPLGDEQSADGAETRATGPKATDKPDAPAQAQDGADLSLF